MLVLKLSIKKDITLSFYKQNFEKKIHEIEEKFSLQNIDLVEIQKEFIDGLREESNESKNTINFIIDAAILKTV